MREFKLSEIPGVGLGGLFQDLQGNSSVAGHCVNMVVRMDGGAAEFLNDFADLLSSSAEVVFAMTGHARPTVPQDFPIEAAENENMPSTPNSKVTPPPVARTRRLTGTLTLGLSKTRTARPPERPRERNPRHFETFTGHAPHS